MKNREIERKFLVKDLSFKQLATSHHEIWQGYLCRDPQRTIRVRIKENKAFLTIKSGNEVSHFEWEKEIEVADAKDLLQICLAGVIHKMRWIVPAEEKNLCWEVDEFLNHPENLILAEIELPSETAVFTKPNFVGEEVTGEAQYYNANMLIN